MKQNNNKHDQELQKQLNQMPGIRDHQTKDELYNKIAVHLKESKPEKKKSNLLPVFAFIAVLLLAAIITPAMLMNSSNDESMLNSSESQNHNTATESGISENREESAELFDTQDDGKDAEQNVPVNDFQSNLVFEVDEGKNYIFSVAAGMNAEHIIPLTIEVSVSDADYTQVTSTAAENADDLGVSVFPLNGAEIVINEDRGEIIFPEDFQTQGGSSSDIILQRSIEQVFGQYGVSEVKLGYEDGRPFEMGNYGTIETMKVSPVQKKSYKIYRYRESGHDFLVPIELKENSSIEDAFDIMANAEGGEYSRSPLPEGVELAADKISDHELLIRVSSTEQLQANQTTMFMVEALLATAASFGYEQVKFEGFPFEVIGNYDLLEPIATPEAVNSIKVNK
ncbi:hypothetical protein ACGTN9_04795 [Halobacillus sp. MO56]